MKAPAIFARGIPRLAALVAAIVGLSVVPLDMLSHGPNICLWCHLFRLSACPACGSTRALCAFFHGEFTQALAFNKNVVVTAPALISMAAIDFRRLLKR